MFAVMAAAMLARDALWSAATSSIAKSRWMWAMVFNSLGDGIAYGSTYLIATVAATSSSGGLALAQVSGEMAGAALGVLVGRFISHVLEHKVQWFWSRP